MIPAIKAEIRKIFSVRSTYAISLFFLGLVGFICFYAKGYKVVPNALNSQFLAGTITPIANITSVAGALIGLLLMAHEYRYGTITHTLTASNSRGKVLTAKLVAVIGVVFVYTAAVTAIGLGLSVAGLVAAGHSLPHQEISYLAFFVKTIFFCEAYALVGLLVPTIVRNMQAAVAVLFIVPNTIEGLLTLIVKHPDKWLPFMALSQLSAPPVPNGAPGSNLVSPLRGAVTFAIYLAIGWAIGWFLFLRRDAS